jgi:hypothetical protein
LNFNCIIPAAQLSLHPISQISITTNPFHCSNASHFTSTTQMFYSFRLHFLKGLGPFTMNSQKKKKKERDEFSCQEKQKH